MTSSFGDSGLAVFQAGHCSWQRPHSVQDVKSSRAFHEWSVTTPVPMESTSGSASSRLMISPSEVIGLAAPRALVPSASRLSRMFANARKRCQATPQVRLRPTTNSQIMPDSSLIRAMIDTNSGDSGMILAIHPVTKSVQWTVPSP